MPDMNGLQLAKEIRKIDALSLIHIYKDAPSNPDGKLNKVAENVWKEYEKGNANGHIGLSLIHI